MDFVYRGGYMKIFKKIFLFLFVSLFTGVAHSYFKKEWLKYNSVILSSIYKDHDISIDQYIYMPASGLLFIESGLLEALYSDIQNDKESRKSPTHLLVDTLFSMQGSPDIRLDQRLLHVLTPEIIGTMVKLGFSGRFNSIDDFDYEITLLNILRNKQKTMPEETASIKDLQGKYNSVKNSIVKKISAEEGLTFLTDIYSGIQLLTKEQEQVASINKRLNDATKKISKTKQGKGRRDASVDPEVLLAQLEKEIKALQEDLNRYTYKKSKEYKVEIRNLERKRNLLENFVIRVASAYNKIKKYNSRGSKFIYVDSTSLILSSVFCFLAAERSDIVSYLNAVSPYKTDQAFQDQLIQLINDGKVEEFNKSDIVSVADIKFKNDLDNLVFTVLSYGSQKQYFPHKISQRSQKQGFTDCVETAIRNLLNYLFYNVETNTFVVPDDKNINKKVIDFYRRYPREDHHNVAIKQEWGMVLSSIPGVKYRDESPSGQSCSAGGCVSCQVASSVENVFKVFSFVFGLEISPRNFVDFITTFSSRDKRIAADVEEDNSMKFTAVITVNQRYSDGQEEQKNLKFIIFPDHSEISFENEMSFPSFPIFNIDARFYLEQVPRLITNIFGFMLFNTVKEGNINNLPFIKLLIALGVREDENAGGVVGVGALSGNVALFDRLKKLYGPRGLDEKAICMSAIESMNIEMINRNCNSAAIINDEFFLETCFKSLMLNFYGNNGNVSISDLYEFYSRFNAKKMESVLFLMFLAGSGSKELMKRIIEEKGDLFDAMNILMAFSVLARHTVIDSLDFEFFNSKGVNFDDFIKRNKLI